MSVIEVLWICIVCLCVAICGVTFCVFLVIIVCF